MFYAGDAGAPLELVINSVTKNHVHGYVAEPKYRASELKAMKRPSGDQLEPAAWPAKLVNCTGFLPSASHTQISSLPERFDVKAILRPSGENCGYCSIRVEEMKLTGAPAPRRPPA